MDHLLEISQLDKTSVQKLISLALEFKHNININENFSYNVLANLFYENSTRTRISFEMAAKYLKMPVINIDLERSSEKKGESLIDMIQTLEAMGVSILVIRHGEETVPQALAKITKKMHIINAGDGKHSHPSQALLDLMTIVENKPKLENLKVVIVGDILHSRVANSFQCISSIMGIGELVLVAPTIWQPSYIHYGSLTDNLKEGIRDADIIMTLRIQHERITHHESLDLDTYRKNYMLTMELIEKYAKPDVKIMHPGPVNREVDIAINVLEGTQSVVLEQVNNGIFMRMAIIKTLLNRS